MSVLVVDLGSSSLRVAEVSEEGEILLRRSVTSQPDRPVESLAELDAGKLASDALEMAESVLAEMRSAGREARAIGVTNQRATTVLWERRTGVPVGPALSWQDLRTLGDCLALQAEGLRLAPNESATKLTWLLHQAEEADISRSDLCFGTLDSWLIWNLTSGACHVTDHTNAGLTGLMQLDGSGWNDITLEHLEIPAEILPEIVASIGVVAKATALPGDIPIAALLGDQQSSLAGLGCFAPSTGKATFGTGTAVNICLGENRVAFERRGENGTFPIICRTEKAADETVATTWGVEALDLAAGTNVAWLGEQWGLFSEPQDSEMLAASCDNTDGVVFVPAIEGLGAPQWDFGARGTFLGITRGTEASHMTRAVLEGVAYRGAELLAATEADSDTSLASLKIDGGMSRNSIFTQTLADATERPVEVSGDPEATSLGAAYLAGYATGIWQSLEEVTELAKPDRVIEPEMNSAQTASNWERWQQAVEQSLSWEESLSEISFL